MIFNNFFKDYIKSLQQDDMWDITYTYTPKLKKASGKVEVGSGLWNIITEVDDTVENNQHKNHHTDGCPPPSGK